MATKGGVITRKDIIEDEALKFGEDYAKNVKLAIDANGKLIASAKELSGIINNYRKVNSQNAFLEEKQKEYIVSLQAINATKQEEAALISMEKIKRQTLATSELEKKAKQAAIDAEIKGQKAKQASVKLTLDERVQNELNNKILKQEALERLGLVSAYSKLNKSRTDAKNNLRDLIASEKASTSEIKKAQTEFDKLDAKVRKADKAVGDFSKNVGNYKSAFNGIGNIFGAFGLVGGLAGFVSITKEIYNTVKELQSLNLALKSVTETQDNFTAQQLFLNDISKKYGLEINNLTKQYTAFYVAAKDKIAANEIQDLFENISKSGSALGLSNETLERSFVALNQMLSKGTIASEELRGQLAEALPGSVQAMLKAVQKLHPEIKNLTEKGLFEMIKAGEILANEVLPETARQLVIITGADKAEGIETITKSTNRLKNAWVDFISFVSENDTVLSSFFSGSMEYLTIFLGGLKEVLATQGQINGMKESEFFQEGVKQFTLEFDAAVGNKSISEQKKYLDKRKKDLTEYVNDSEKEVNRLTKIVENASFLFPETEAKNTAEEISRGIGSSKGELKALQDKINEINKPKIINPDNKSDKDADKKEKDPLARAKKLNDSKYELEKQRLERIISINNEIAKDDEETDEMRIAALEESQKKQISLAELTKKHSLDADKFVTKENKLNANQKAIIANEASYKIIDINKKTSEEIEKINEFDTKLYDENIKRGLATIEIANNEEIAAENDRYNQLKELGFKNDKAKEKAAEDHERILFNIKKEGLIAQTRLQISTLSTEIDAYQAQSDGSQKSQDFILEKRRQVAELSAKLTQAEGEVFKENEDDKGKKVKESLEEIYQISSDATNALSDLASAFNERKIQEIDNEIDKNNEYYDKQIELAGNDERQKDIYNQQREKKNEELEKKKRKEQEKQAKFEKAVTIAQISLQTALAIIKAAATTAPTFWAVAIAAGIGAIQLGAALATPIPKYKDGRKGGPKEIAMINDGGVTEVVEHKDGTAETYSGKNRIVQLLEGDTVHKSIQDYEKLQYAAMMANIQMQGRKMSEFQANQYFNTDNKELLEELKRNTRAVEKNKSTVVVNQSKLDINHHLWKMKNTNWN